MTKRLPPSPVNTALARFLARIVLGASVARFKKKRNEADDKPPKEKATASAIKVAHFIPYPVEVMRDKEATRATYEAAIAVLPDEVRPFASKAPFFEYLNSVQEWERSLDFGRIRADLRRKAKSAGKTLPEDFPVPFQHEWSGISITIYIGG